MNDTKETNSKQAGGDELLQLVSFNIGDEEFGVDILKVQEINRMVEVTRVPNTPEYVDGVINLRGKVIPVVDLRLKFGLPEMEYTQRTCIIVVQVRGEAGPMQMGIVVDGVAEVLNLADADIEDTPAFGQDVTVSYLLGMAKIKGKVKILLDIDQVLTTQELQVLEAVLPATKE